MGPLRGEAHRHPYPGCLAPGNRFTDVPGPPIRMENAQRHLRRTTLLGLDLSLPRRRNCYLPHTRSLPLVGLTLWTRVHLFTFFLGILGSSSSWYASPHLYLIALFDIPQVETAVEKRTVDKDVLLHIAAGRVACAVAERLLQYSKYHISHPLNLAIKQFYSTHIFHAMARLDLPTFEDPAIQRQLEGAWSTSYKSSVAWETIRLTSNVIMTVIRLLSQLSVLISVLRHQRDGTLLALLSFSQSLFQWFSGMHHATNSLGASPVSYPVISCLHNRHLLSMGCNDQRQGLHPHAGLQASRGQSCTPQRSCCRLPRRTLDKSYASSR